jgi:hypothetical protein
LISDKAEVYACKVVLEEKEEYKAVFEQKEQ